MLYIYCINNINNVKMTKDNKYKKIYICIESNIVPIIMLMFSESSYCNVNQLSLSVESFQLFSAANRPRDIEPSCSHFAYKNMLYEEYENPNCHQKYFVGRQKLRREVLRSRFSSLRGAKKTFRISNFINVKVIPNRDSFTGKSLLRSLRGIVPKIINIRIGYWNRYISCKLSTSRWETVSIQCLYIYSQLYDKIYIFSPYFFIACFINFEHFTRHIINHNSISRDLLEYKFYQ